MLTLIALKLGHKAWKRHKRKKFENTRAILLHENKMAKRLSRYDHFKREKMAKLKKSLPKYQRKWHDKDN